LGFLRPHQPIRELHQLLYGYIHLPNQQVYRAWFCGNACQKVYADIPFQEPKPAFVQGIGKRTRILFFNYCRIGLHPRATCEGLTCAPSW
jgi:hypothetical protein